MKQRRILLAAAVTALVVTGAVHASGRNERPDTRKNDHEEARKAFQSGEIRALGDILADLRSQVNWQVIEVELSGKRGAYVYELKILSPEGRVLELELDAKTGRVIKRESR